MKISKASFILIYIRCHAPGYTANSTLQKEETPGRHPGAKGCILLFL
jgi:hypothetical protein